MVTKCIIKDNNENTVATGGLRSRERDTFRVALDEQFRGAFSGLLGTSLKIYLFDESAGIQIYAAEVTSADDNTVCLSGTEKLQRIQRRNDVKIKMSVALMIHPVRKDIVDGKDAFICNVAQKIHITLRDISAGGLGFYSKSKLEKDQLYLLVFPFTWTPVELLFVVLRSTEEKNGTYFYGCKLKGISTHDERMLRSFIYYRGLASNNSCSQED